MTAANRILVAIAVVIVISGGINFAVEHFHPSQTFASEGIGVAIGMGVALAALSLTPKGTKSN